MDIQNYRTPGQLIEALLTERGWTQRLFAEILNVDETGINKLISGKKTVTAQMSIVLGEVFGVPAEDFLSLQQEYDLAQARIVSRPDANRATRARLFGDFPITEMIKRGWLEADSIRDMKKVEASLIKFFGVSSVDEIINEIDNIPHAAKKTKTFTPVTPVQLAWIYRVRELAEEMVVVRYSPTAVRKAVSLLSNLLASPEEVRNVPKILAECGIRYVIVESLSSAKIDGVCFWLNDFSPVIGMSLRYDRIDNFWFVLRHEIEHVLRHHGKSAMMVDSFELEREKDVSNDNISEEERVANEAALNFCVPQKTLESFVARKYPYFNDRDILGLAQTLKIHPGLVAGQLQHRINKYDRFRQYLVKIRAVIGPSALVDGWGNIAPVGY
jgi:HTH-type transcriptional regulator/antitoxin HigA